MTFPVLSAGTSAYNLQRSLRFRSSASAYLNRTPASASNRRTWTWSAWVKRGTFANNLSALFSAGADVNNFNELRFTDLNSGVFDFTFVTGGADTARITTTPVYRDPSAWYHVVVALDTTQATAANRVKIYVNGVQVTSLTTATYPTQNSTWYVNAANAHGLGATVAVGRYFDGYLTEVNFIDGQALTPSSFGSTNAVTGVWQPARYTGTYGTNGFYLPFTNLTSTSTLGNDFSGNSNNWTTNNISLTAGVTYDSMTDVPTLTSPTAANFAVLNPLNVVGATISGGNLNTSTGTTQGFTVGTIGIPTTGKYYFEVTNGSTTAPAQVSIGLQVQASPPTSFSAAGGYTLYLGYAGATANLYINNNGTNSSANVVSTTASDVLNLAYDASTGKLWLGYNNVWKNSSGATDGAANPATGANPTITISAGLSLFPFHHVYSNTASINFGQRPFAYTPPSGFVALNTFNLPSSTIPAGNKFMGATLYTGTSATQTITNSGGMQPDLVWTKARSNLSNQAWFDSVRGGSKVLFSDLADAEYTGTYISSFNSNGFTIGATPSSALNLSGYTYVAWQWKANGAGVTNTAGSITSTVSANTTSGFSVVTYTGTGANATVGHGLGIAPWMVIVKRRDSTGNWPVFHRNAGSDAVGFLNSSVAFSSPEPTYWNTTSPSSTVFSIGTNSAVNASGGTYVAYVFSETAGFSSIGRYTGNGSADGPFVYTGFRPRFILIKERDADRNWQLIDSARLGYNGATNPLSPNTAGAEPGAAERVDFLSNGFKPRTSAADFNISSGAYMYIAFAENPFKNALAR